MSQFMKNTKENNAEIVNIGSFSDSHLSKRKTTKGVRFEFDLTKLYRICLVGILAQDNETIEAAKKFGLPTVTSEDGLEYTEDEKYVTYFILSDFDTEEFETLNRPKIRIIGKPAFMEMSLEGVIVHYKKPIYCLTMTNCLVGITGFKDTEVIDKLIRLICFMGGSYMRELPGENKNRYMDLCYTMRLSNTDEKGYMVAYSSLGETYHFAIENEIPVMSVKWIEAAWDYRNDIKIKINDTNFLRYKLDIFQNLKIVLVGFSNEDRTNMELYIKKNGGFSTTLQDSSATHVVVSFTCELVETLNFPSGAFVVKERWFWDSLAEGHSLNESLHLYDSIFAKYLSTSKYKPDFLSLYRREFPAEPLCRSRTSPVKTLFDAIKDKITKTHKSIQYGTNCKQYITMIITIIAIFIIILIIYVDY